MVKCQTLVELLVAISLTVLGVSAIVGLAVSSLRLSGGSLERVTAVSLAREGMEIVSSIRDSNWLDPDQSWPFGLSNGSFIASYNDLSFTTTTGVTISNTPVANSDFTSCSNCGLTYSSATGLYTHSGGGSTIFKRAIVISNGSSSEEKRINVAVQWIDNIGTHVIELEKRLTNWK